MKNIRYITFIYIFLFSQLTIAMPTIDDIIELPSGVFAGTTRSIIHGGVMYELRLRNTHKVEQDRSFQEISQDSSLKPEEILADNSVILNGKQLSKADAIAFLTRYNRRHFVLEEDTPNHRIYRMHVQWIAHNGKIISDVIMELFIVRPISSDAAMAEVRNSRAAVREQLDNNRAGQLPVGVVDMVSSYLEYSPAVADARATAALEVTNMLSARADYLSGGGEEEPQLYNAPVDPVTIMASIQDYTLAG